MGLIQINTLLAEEPTRPPRPNIVFIFADDLGWTDLSCQGSGYYQTPHIDRLAHEGLSMSSFYVCQNCAPTRAALMSGQYPPRTGVYTVGTLARGEEVERRMVPPENVTSLRLDVITLADVLRSAGYATGMFGKWHLGNSPRHHPSQRGFQEAIIAEGRHFQFASNPPLEVDEQDYLADVLTDLAVEFIEQHAEEPFFLYLPHFAVHVPLQAKPELVAQYADRQPVGGHGHAVYAAMIHSLDESVGRILDLLERLDLDRRTLVIFSSDNGGLGGYVVPETGERKGHTDNFPLRGGKGTLYEGGIRVPCLIRWLGIVPAGAVSDCPAIHVDLFPTLVELAGGELPSQQVLDGVSLAELWVDLAVLPDSLATRSLYWHFPGYLESYIPETTWRTTPVSVIRTGDYKLLHFLEEDTLELYDLADDLSEIRNLVESEPQRTRELYERLDLWRNAIGAPMPIHKPEHATHPGE